MYENPLQTPCKVSITGQCERGVVIELYDEKSGITFAKVTLSNEQFVYAALNRLQRVQAEDVKLYHMDKVGKQVEHKYVTVDITEIEDRFGCDYHKRVLNFLKAYVNNEFSDGWIMHDMLQSQNSIVYRDEKVFANFHIVRWV